MAYLPGPEDDAKDIVYVTDALARNFQFPLESVKTWEGLQVLLIEAFREIHILDKEVQKGHYDLTDEAGHTILPSLWSQSVKPGWKLKMSMWPTVKPPKARGEGYYAPPVPPPPVPPGMNPPPMLSETGPYPHVGVQHYPPPPPPPLPPHMRPPGWPQGAPRSVPLPTTFAQPGAVPPYYPQPSPPFPHSAPPAPHGVVSPRNARVSAPAVFPRVKTPPTKRKPRANVMTFLAGKPPAKKKSEKISTTSNIPSIPFPRAKPTARYASVAPALRHAPALGHAPAPGYAPAARPSSPAGHDAWSEPSSSDSSDDFGLGARRNTGMGGLITSSARPTQDRGLLRRWTFNSLEKNPAPVAVHHFSSVCLYGGKWTDGVDDGGVLLELTRDPSPPVRPKGEGGKAENTRWLHVVRNVMDFDEFEHMALSPDYLATNQDVCVAIESVFRLMRDRKLEKSRNGWYIKPGSVAKCVVNSKKENVASAILATVPHLQVDSFTRSFAGTSRKSACVPRRLHEAFNPYDASFERDRNQVFRKHEGSTSNEILWIGETWILIVDSVGIFTYGGKDQQSYLGNNIEIKEPPKRGSQERLVHVSVSVANFQIPLARCENYFDLRSCIQSEVELALERDEDELEGFRLQLADGEPLTADKWSRLVQNTEQSTIRVTVKLNDDDVSSETTVSDSYQSSSFSDAAESTDLGNDDSSVETGGSSIHPADEFFAIHKEPLEEKPAEADFNLAHLDPLVPPFLGWSVVGVKGHKDGAANSTADAKEGDLRESTSVCLGKVATALREMRLSSSMTELHEQFPTLNSELDGTDARFKNVEEMLLKLSSSTAGSPTPEPKFYDESTVSLYKDFVQAAVRALEAFAPRDFPSSVIFKYYDALLSGLKLTKRQSANAKLSRWVIVHDQGELEPGFRDSDPLLMQKRCSECYNGTIYDSFESAQEHLASSRHRKIPEDERDKRISPLPKAATAALQREYSNVLGTCRDSMRDMVQQSRDIQSGMVFNGRFRQPARGVPYAMIQSLAMIASVVFAISLLLSDIHAHYEASVYDRQCKSLNLPSAIRDKYDIVKEAGDEAAALMKTAERALISSLRSTRKEDAAKFFSVAGPHCIATQMISNLLRAPIHNNADVSELYESYVGNYESQILRRPRKPMIPVIGAVSDELARLSKVTEWQQNMVSSLRAALAPRGYLEPTKTQRKDTFLAEDLLIENLSEELQGQFDRLDASKEKCESLIKTTRQLLEIIQDDNSRLIFVFTAVTVIFLPLSFIAAYLSMNGGPSQKDWRQTQATFWEAAMPLAVAIILFCLVAAWRGSDVGVWRDRISRTVASRSRIQRSRRRSRSSSASSSASSSDDGSLTRSRSRGWRHRRRRRSRSASYDEKRNERRSRRRRRSKPRSDSTRLSV